MPNRKVRQNPIWNLLFLLKVKIKFEFISCYFYFFYLEVYLNNWLMWFYPILSHFIIFDLFYEVYIMLKQYNKDFGNWYPRRLRVFYSNN